MIKELKKDYDKILKSSFITKNEVNELKIFCEKN